MMELGHRETKPFRKRLELSVEENKSKTKGVRLSGDIAQLFYHLVKERIISPALAPPNSGRPRGKHVASTKTD
jgi:hypothetical protein